MNALLKEKYAIKTVFVYHAKITHQINHKFIKLGKLLIIETLTFSKISLHLSLSGSVHVKSHNVERNIVNVTVQELNVLKNVNVIHVRMENVIIKIKIDSFRSE